MSAQTIIHVVMVRKRIGVTGYPQVRKGRVMFGRLKRNTITHDTARAANKLSVKPAYCWISAIVPDRMMIVVTAPWSISDARGAPDFASALASIPNAATSLPNAWYTRGPAMVIADAEARIEMHNTMLTSVAPSSPNRARPEMSPTSACPASCSTGAPSRKTVLRPRYSSTTRLVPTSSERGKSRCGSFISLAMYAEAL